MATQPSPQGEVSRAFALNLKATSAPTIQRKCGCGGNSELQDEQINRAIVQPSLTISNPGDPYEVEADRVADQVMQTPDGSAAGASIQRFVGGPSLSRACSSCAAKERGGGDVSSSVARATIDDGRQLDAGTQAFMESRFGRSFDNVRVHTGGGAAESARSIDALAYTVGSDIVFAEGRYAPQTSSGRRLIAHELAHTVQQGGGGAGGMASPKNNSSLRRSPLTVMPQSAGCSCDQEENHDAPIVQRAPLPPTGGTKPAAPAIPRAEEVERSLTSPGQITIGINPAMISLYNFPIDQAVLKPEHQAALESLGKIFKHAGGAKMYIAANGHADSTGEADINGPLSRSRAIAVQGRLEKLSGKPIDPSWFGSSIPATSNDTVDGRSRNRRVDLYFWMPNKIDDDKKKKKDDDDGGGGGDDGGGGGGGGGWGPWSFPDLCGGLLGALFCGVVACAFAPEICLFCMENPEICLGRHIPKPPKPPKEEPKHQRIACPDFFEISKIPVIDPYSTTWLMVPFTMKAHFKQEDPSKNPYCDCNCGEYRQEVSGFFIHPTFPGYPPRLQEHEIANGKKLDVNDMSEDGPRPYGHRYEDAARTKLRPNVPKVDSFLNDTGGNDPKDGCRYEGYDEPGISISPMSDEVHIHLKFRAGPFDACNNREVGSWKEWSIRLDRDPNKPPPPTPGPNGPIYEA